jgi:prepilin-type N-terminal cleavage/methylation domain-containing protein
MFNLKLKTKNLKPTLGERGYTMIEMVIALTIMGSLIFTIVTVYKTINRSMWQVEEKSQLEKALIFTMEQMAQEIRQAVNITTLGSTKGVVTSDANVHLDQNGVTICSFRIPNMTEPLDRKNDAILMYFLKKMPDNSVKLYQRMMYYNNAYTEAFPAMASTDQYRLGNPRATPAVEPGPGASITPTPANTPVPVYKDDLGRDPGLYKAANLNFDDVCFYYDSDNAILAISMTASLKSKSIYWKPGSRRTKTLTCSVALRRLR